MFWREMRLNAKGFVLWTIALVLLFGGIVLAYPWMIGDELSGSIDTMLAVFPESLLRAFNMDIASVSRASDWIKSEGLALYVLAGAIYAALLGSQILLKEQANRTLEDLWSLPVSRTRIVLAHYLPGLLYVVLLQAATAGAICGTLALTGDFNATEMLPLLCAPLLVLAAAYSLCFALSTLFQRSGAMNALGLALVLIGYVLHLLGRMNEKMQPLGNVSLFALWDVRRILERGYVSAQEICAGALIVGLSLLFSIVVYEHKPLV